MRAFDVGGGGNCMFLSVAYQLFGDCKKHVLVRHKAAKYIMTHVAFYQQLISGMTVAEYAIVMHE